MLTVKTNPINLGDVKFGVKNTFVFNLKNTSNKTIIINKLLVGCTSCTKASTSLFILDPGTETNIDVEYTPGSTGRTSKYVYVTYDTDKELKLEFKANVLP